MAQLYTTYTLNNDDWDAIQRERLAEQQRLADIQQRYEQAKLQSAQNKPQGGLLDGLGSVLSGIGNTIGTAAKGIGDFVTSGAINAYAGTGLKSLLEGKDYATAAKEAERDVTDFKKRYYNTDSAKDAYLKSAGTVLDTASTVSDFIPGVGTAGKVAMNVAQGGLSGISQNFINNGENATLEDTLKGAAAGMAGAGVGQAVGGKLAAKAGASKNLLARAATSNIGRGALTGAAAGATGAGVTSALNGGSLTDVLSNAAQGAQGGALGGATMAGLYGLAGAGMDKLKGKIEEPRQTAVQPIDQVDADNAEKTTMLGRALKNAGNDLEAAQTNITRAERRKFGIKDAGETVDNLRKRTGFSNVDDQAAFAKNITGGPDSVMDTIQKYNISVDENGKPITLRTDQYEVAINDAVGKDWKKSVMGESYDQFRTDLIADIQNEDPITASNWLKREAATQRGIAEAKGPTADKAARKAQIYTEVANKIDDLSYSAVPQKNVNRMFDDTIDEFYARADEAAKAGNKQYANAYTKLAKELEGTDRTIANYRSFKKDFVKSSQLAEISRGAQSGSLEAGNKRGNVVGRVVNTLTEEPINRTLAWLGGKLSDAGDVANGATTGRIGRAIGGAANAVGGLAGALNNASLDTTGLGDILTRQTARQAALGQSQRVDNRAAAQEAQNAYNNATNDYNNTMANIQAAAQNINAAAAERNDPGLQQLRTISDAMQLALNAGDLTSYNKLADLYQQAYKIYGKDTTTSTAKTADKLTDNQTKALTGLGQLNQLASMTPGMGTVLSGSPLGGVVNMFGGDDYANQAQALALTLGYLQSGANVSKNEAENIGKSYIPTAFDSDSVRQQKLERARQLLNNYLQGTQYYQG